MTTAIKARLNELSVEEFANTVTHGFGLLLSVAGFFALVVMAGLRGEPVLIAACIVYGVSLVILYAASTIYHGTTSPELKQSLRIVDHCCIYLLIAGTYTPFGLVIVDGRLGQNVLIAIWLFEIYGIIEKLTLDISKFLDLSALY